MSPDVVVACTDTTTPVAQMVPDVLGHKGNALCDQTMRHKGGDIREGDTLDGSLDIWVAVVVRVSNSTKDGSPCEGHKLQSQGQVD